MAYITPEPHGQDCSAALFGMRDLNDDRTSSNFGGGAPNPFVVCATPRFTLPPPPFAAWSDDVE